MHTLRLINGACLNACIDFGACPVQLPIGDNEQIGTQRIDGIQADR